MGKFDKVLDKMGKIGYGVGIIVAAGGLFDAIFNKENRMDKMSKRVEELEKTVKELKESK